jgi:hypothetical protein
MNITLPAHQEMLLALLSNNVEFMLVGGYAVVYHGYVRTTGDMDIWLKPSNENRNRLVDLLKNLNFDPEGVNRIAALDFTEVVAFHIGHEPEKIDFLTKIQGVDFEAAYQRKQILNLKNLQVPVLHLNDLIANKIMTNRSKDVADVDYLKRVNKWSSDASDQE